MTSVTIAGAVALAAALYALLSSLGRCTHARTTFPQTIKGETCVACLDCGTRLLYDWKAMRITGRWQAKKEESHA